MYNSIVHMMDGICGDITLAYFSIFVMGTSKHLTKKLVRSYFSTTIDSSGTGVSDSVLKIGTNKYTTVPFRSIRQ